VSQNVSGDSLTDDRDDVAARTARRTLAKRQAAYADEVRRLLEAGIEVMRRSGTTRSPRVSDIVEEAGLSRDAFYRHFASKEDLVAAIVDAGEIRLVGYLRHQMEKESEPSAQVRRWIEGIMSQAGNREVAHSTRAVLWNGGRVGDGSRPDAAKSSGRLAELLVAPVEALGSIDPVRDAVSIAHATIGLMQEFLWRFAAPTKDDVAHLVRFCSAAVRP
jgi:AcrR family transcriptional regulator